MSIDAELKKDGIEVTEILSKNTINNIATQVSSKLCQTFPNYGLNEDDLLNRISNLEMYKAKMPERNVRSKLLL